MVSTRQMTNVGGAASSSDEAESASRPQRHNSVITIVSTYSMQNSNETPSVPGSSYVPPSSVSLLDMPHEIIEKILVYVGYKKIAQMRLVCRQLNHSCSSILNSTFSRLQTQMLSRFQAIKSKMPRRESARRSHPLACESDIVETLHMRLTLLQMTFGKHIERRHCCFFPGEILDEVYRILHYIRVTQKLARPYKVTDELFDLSTMAMEYFKERIEPALPEIAYFGTDFLDFTGTFSAGSVSKSYLCLEDGTHDHEVSGAACTSGALSSPPSSPAQSPSSRHQNTPAVDQLVSVVHQQPAPVMPQCNMVLRKRIRKIKQGMKRYNSQLSVLRNDLRNCKRKTTEQQRQISEQQKQLAEQQKQTLEYATRLDENDKKNEETSRKFSTLLHELNKCKTDLQYWRSKSPATPLVCNGCGAAIEPMNQDDLKALMNQGVKPEDDCLDFNMFSTEKNLSTISEIPEVSTAGQSNDTLEEVTVETKKEITVEENEVKVNSPKAVKRKIEETATSSNSNSLGKKLRRGLKTRCGKVRSK